MQEREALKMRAREYSREYRREGFGRLCDRRYYERHREEILRKKRERYKRRET